MSGTEIPIGLCQCGCGRRTEVSSYTNRRHGFVKGQPRRYVRGHPGRPIVDMTGQRIGRLTVSKRDGSDSEGHPLWLCLCDCGEERHLRGVAIRGKKPRESCGCLSRERASKRERQHGHSHGYTDGAPTPTYRSWTTMKVRCLNPNHEAYERYAGRGITICGRWVEEGGFANFLADMGERPDGKTLDRIDNDGNYEPSNCRWATASEQAANRRNGRNAAGQFLPA